MYRGEEECVWGQMTGKQHIYIYKERERKHGGFRGETENLSQWDNPASAVVRGENAWVRK